MASDFTHLKGFMENFNVSDIALLLVRLKAATGKMLSYAPVVTDAAEIQAMSKLNDRAAHYVVDLSSLLQEEAIPVSAELTALVDMVEVFCREIEALPEPILST